MALVAIRSGGSEPPLVCVHARAGHVRLYQDLARHLDTNLPMYGLEAPAPNGRSAAYHDFGELAARYAREVRSVQQHGPYRVLGECLGGPLAFELASQLRSGDERVRLVLIDTFRTGEPPLSPRVPRGVYRLVHRSRILVFHVVNLVRLRSRLSYAGERAVRALQAVRRASSGPAAHDVGTAAFDEALAAYEPMRFGGPVVLFRATKLPLGVESAPDLGWAEVVDELEIVLVPGYFTTVVSEPHVGVLAEKLQALLAEDLAGFDLKD